MIAAIVVLVEHVISRTNSQHFMPNQHLRNLFSLGAFAVMVFFGLSGIALRYQTDKSGGADLAWLGGRLVRLLPMYWSLLVLPVVAYAVFYPSHSLNYPDWAYPLTFLGLNAFSNDASIFLPPVNAPLWSLGVEIWLSVFLLALSKIRRKFYFLGLISLLAIPFTLFRNSPIALALPVFFLGYILPTLKIKTSSSKVLQFFLAAPILLFFGLFSNVILDVTVNSFVDYLFETLLVVCLLTYCLVFPGKLPSGFSNFSQRSFALYACHFPVFLICTKLFLSNNELTFANFFLVIICVFITTEFTYRFIDLPSIKCSRKILNKERVV
jgi:hypothetical protein